MRGRVGLGEEPGYYCYDPKRPSWLPYWIDSISESLCKWNPATIAGNIAHCVAGSPDCGVPSAAQRNPNLAGPYFAPADAGPDASNNPNCTGFQTYNFETGKCEFDPSRPSFLALVLGGVAVFAMVARR